MRILYLFPRNLWSAKMSLGRVLYGEALARQPGVELAWSGIGWPGFDASKTVMENCGPADALWLYKPEGLKGLEEYPVRFLTFNEANAPKTLDEIRDAQANLVVFHHGNDIPRWQLDGIRTAHVLHCADPQLMDSINWHDRPIDVLLTGVTSPEVYPLRHRFKRLIGSGQIPGTIRRHPGNRLKSHERCRQQYAEYRKQLASAKIVLCCSSVFRYPLAKYVEAFASGAAVIGDMPDDPLFLDTLGRCLIEISPDDTDETICRTVRDWLSRPQELRDRADMGRQMVAEQFTTDHYAQRILDQSVRLTL